MQIRLYSFTYVRKLGYSINPDIPLLDEPNDLKTKEAIISRALCLFTSLACHFGLPSSRAIDFLTKERLDVYLTDTERAIIFDGAFMTEFEKKIEALWELSWILMLVPKIKHNKPCESYLSSLFPKISTGESADNFKNSIKKIRNENELLQEADIAYCIHWSVLSECLEHKPTKVSLSLAEERRRAIDWVLYEETWDDVPMDT